MQAAGRWAQGCWVFISLLCFCSAAVAQSESELLRRAQDLAGEKHFAAAETRYHEVLQRSPSSHQAALGLAQVILWEGRYREARRRFKALVARFPTDVDAMEGAATAAYWQGDFRTAAREFSAIAAAHPERRIPQTSLAEIQSAARGDVRVLMEGVDDDQPYRAWRTSARVSSFSDPLTRWDVTAGAYRLENPTRGIARTEPFVLATNEIVLPWQRLTITTTAGVLRWPDATTRPIGGLTFAHKLSSNTSVSVTGERRELLTNSTAVITHAAVTRFVAAWNRNVPRGWLAGIEAGHNRYYDRNSGGYAQAYLLWPVLKRDHTTVWLGASAAIRDTRETRFELDTVSSTRSPAGDFLYSYRGSYRAYWTPRNFREGRAIATVAQTIGKGELKLQAERGVAREEERAFGPSSGGVPLPSMVFAIDFERTFNPYRFSAGLSMPVSTAFRLECAIERNVTAFYAANVFRASLVRHR
jgi:hypothetical protein